MGTGYPCHKVTKFAVWTGTLFLCACTTKVEVSKGLAPASKETTTSTSTDKSNVESDKVAPTFTLAGTISSNLDYSLTPTITVGISEDATVTLYSDSSCAVSISSGISLTAGTGKTLQPSTLAASRSTTIYVQAVDASGNKSSCAQVGTYTHLMKFQDPNPSAGNGFGNFVAELTNGNIVIASAQADIGGVTDSGAVYLFNGVTGALISTLYGTSTNDQVGGSGVFALKNGNFLVSSVSWDCTASNCPTPAANATVTDVGAVTWCSGTSGCSGAVTSLNSLVGSAANEQVGLGGGHKLSNGNYLVVSPYWDCTPALCPPPAANANVANVGAVTFGNGTTGTTGPISSLNSLVGSTANDYIGNDGIAILTNGNYAVASRAFNCTATLCPAPAVAATVSDVGAVTWGNGTTGTVGPVTSANSLVGSEVADFVGKGGVRALTNGNYVVISPEWDCSLTKCPAPAIAATGMDVGAVTWGNGATGTTGTVTSANSLVGSAVSDQVGSGGVAALTNGHYVVSSPIWDCSVSRCPSPAIQAAVSDVGAATWGNGATGTTGSVTSLNSLVGSTASDNVGANGVTALTNGNYVVASASWDCTVLLCPAPAVAAIVSNVGAATWGNGTTGTSGPVSSTNSLVGSTSSDGIGNMGVVALTNGNYVVRSTDWDCTAALCPAPAIASSVVDVGAATWGNGATGTFGHINSTNSLVGSTLSDTVGHSGITALTNGNYVVRSSNWDCTATLCPAPAIAASVANVGAATWGSGTTGVSGPANSSNSLVGSSASDGVGNTNLIALTNGNYVVHTKIWDCTVALCPAPAANATAIDVGAVTWGNGAIGISGAVTSLNSLVGRSPTDLSTSSVVALSNGHYVLQSATFDCSAIACPAPAAATSLANAGIVIWNDGTTGRTGPISSQIGLVGNMASDQLGGLGIDALSNGNILVKSSLLGSPDTPTIFEVSGSEASAGPVVP